MKREVKAIYERCFAGREKHGNSKGRLWTRSEEVDDATYASLFRWCGEERALCHGRRLHAAIRASGRDRSTFLANFVIQMYGKCGSVEEARNVFNGIRRRDIFSWNFIISAFAHNGHEAEALQVYKLMQIEGARPDKFTFFPLLSASAALKSLPQAQQIHKSIIAHGLESNIALNNSLVTMYGKCGAFQNAREVFNKLPVRDVISWNAMIAAYAHNGCGMEAIEVFNQMDFEGIKPDRITFLAILDACASMRSLKHGKAVHEWIVESGFECDITLKNALLNMYGKCGSLKDVKSVFDKMQKDRNVISWTAMITVYVKNGCGKEALQLFKEMELNGIKPNQITFLSTLDACATLASLEIGRAIHKCILSSGFGSDVSVMNALVTMYGKCGSLQDGLAVFENMHERDLISWNTMIAAFAQNHCNKEALQLLEKMEMEQVKPNKITFLNCLTACANLSCIENGISIHECIVANELDSDVAICAALVNMYGKCRSLKHAHTVFDRMPERNLILWTAMIAACTDNGQCREALELFRQMCLQGLKPDGITFVCTLNACASLASLEDGRAIHEQIIASQFESDLNVINALMDMYGKCGFLKNARAVFDKMPERNVISWTTMITAYAQNGYAKEALYLFKEMEFEGLKLDRVIFLSILNACSHAGLLKAGWHFFVSISADYGVMPLEEHYMCMADLLGRAGCLDEVENLIINMHLQATYLAWATLLGACRIHGDWDRGKRVIGHVSQLGQENASAHVLLSNMYAATGRWVDAAKTRKAVVEI